MQPSPTLLEHAIRVAKASALSSTCQKAQVGSVIFDATHIVSVGFNANPQVAFLCDTVACQVQGKQDSNCAKVHAEIKAIRDLPKRRSTTLFMYCTHFPCLACMHRIEETGIRQVYYSEPNGWLRDVPKFFPNITFTQC